MVTAYKLISEELLDLLILVSFIMKYDRWSRRTFLVIIALEIRELDRFWRLMLFFNLLKRDMISSRDLYSYPFVCFDTDYYYLLLYYYIIIVLLFYL